MAILKKTFNLGGVDVTLESGILARQADGAVVLKAKNLVLLATVVVNQSSAPVGFLPLSVHYLTKSYAYGRVPGGFKRREGPPTEHEILVSRLIDRPIRPLFPSDFYKEVQVIVTLLSSDASVEADVFALIAARAALGLAGLPLTASLGAVRIGYLNAERTAFSLNPLLTQTHGLDLVLAGNEQSLFMVECASSEVPEDQMVEALAFGQKVLADLCSHIDAFIAQGIASQQPFDCESKNEVEPEAWKTLCDQFVSSNSEAYWMALCAQGVHKANRQAWMKTTFDAWVLACSELVQNPEVDVKPYITLLIEQLIRQKTLESGQRLDGRAYDEIRPISIETSYLPSAHGSALFTRGWTQSLTNVILGTAKDAQYSDSYDPNAGKDLFLLHYNFPAYSVGETGAVSSPKRREIGHGRLARKAVESMLPSQVDFPYVLRIVSEILESDGSSSMATVCASTMALMDAGVPLKKPVAGIAMGLIQDAQRTVVLSDICGEEDAFGDMDFKVAGTQDGITALQMDIKVCGINAEVMKVALLQAQKGRLQILSLMSSSLASPRSELSATAPRIEYHRVRTEQIRDIIGKGGSTIKMISETSGATLEISDDGIVTIVSYTQESAEKAKTMIQQITDPLTIGQIYEGTVTKMLEFGFVVMTLAGKDGLVHISECPFPQSELNQQIAMGQKVSVKLIQIDRVNNKYKFSMLLSQ